MAASTFLAPDITQAHLGERFLPELVGDFEIVHADCSQSAVDAWLDGLDRLTPVALSLPAAKAVREAREAEDAAVTDAFGRP